MNFLPDALFSNIIWTALHTVHSRFAISHGLACRYPADVAPFATVAQPSRAAFGDLATLLTSHSDSVWLFDTSLPAHSALKVVDTLPCLRMIPSGLPLPLATRDDILPLTAADAPEMVALTSIAFPGFFRPRTVEMGSYFGIRDRAGRLISMCGERIALTGHAEASGLCTHPHHRGHGYGEALLWQVLRQQRDAGVASFFHVGMTNTRAQALYRRMGFVTVAETMLTRVALG